MDTAAAARARRGINRRGHLLRFKRGGTSVEVKATSKGYKPEELVAGMSAGTRFLIVSRLDLEAAGFPVPLVKGDAINFGSDFAVPTTVQSVDVDHREYQACYEVTTKGN